MKKRDTVSATVRMKITIWAMGQSDKLKTTSVDDCKGLIKKEFGAMVSTNFVRDLYNAAGIRIPRVRPSIPDSATDASNAKDKLGLRLRVLARIVRNGFKDAGLPIPPTLDILCTGNGSVLISDDNNPQISLEKNNGQG